MKCKYCNKKADTKVIMTKIPVCIDCLIKNKKVNKDIYDDREKRKFYHHVTIY